MSKEEKLEKPEIPPKPTKQMPKFDEKGNEIAPSVNQPVAPPKIASEFIPNKDQLRPKLNIQERLNALDAKHKPVDNSKVIIENLHNAGKNEPELGKLADKYLNPKIIEKLGAGPAIAEFNKKVQESNVSQGHKKYVGASAEVIKIEQMNKNDFQAFRKAAANNMQQYNNANDSKTQNALASQMQKMSHYRDNKENQFMQSKKEQYRNMQVKKNLAQENKISPSMQARHNKVTPNANGTTVVKISKKEFDAINKANSQQLQKVAKPKQPQKGTPTIEINKEQLNSAFKKISKDGKNIITQALKDKVRLIAQNMQKKLEESRKGKMALNAAKGVKAGVQAGVKAFKKSMQK